MGYDSVAEIRVIGLAVDATKLSLRNPVKFEVIAVKGHPRTNVIDVDAIANRKRPHNFLLGLVINSNFGLMLYSFRD